MIKIDGRYLEQITKENVDGLIIIDWCADAHYQEDGGVDFMLEPTEEEEKLAKIVFEREFDFDECEIMGYVTVSSDKGTVEMELVYRADDTFNPIDFRLTPTETALVLERLEQEVKDKFHMTLDEMLREAKGE